jgi:hypothetical protein
MHLIGVMKALKKELLESFCCTYACLRMKNRFSRLRAIVIMFQNRIIFC